MRSAIEELYPALKQLREWLDNDVSQLLRQSRTPVLYGTALCILAGCEALSRLLNIDPPHGIFARELIEHHGKGFTGRASREPWEGYFPSTPKSVGPYL
jgi:hypothetical protein